MSLTVLCFDYGVKKIGVAIGNTLTQTASELTVLPCKNQLPAWQSLDLIIQQWQPDGLVVGLPLNMDGSENKQCLLARKFAKALADRYDRKVEFEDERLSSNQADSMIRNTATLRTKSLKQKVAQRDQLAAKLILETYLSRNA